MHPILFDFAGYPAPAYAVFMILGFAAALLVIRSLAPRSVEGLPRGGFDQPQAFDLYLVMLVSAIFGSKVGHVLFEAPGHRTADGRAISSVWELLLEDPWHPFDITDPGYVWYGGLLACLGVAIVYFRRRPRLDAWLFSDAFAPAIMVGAVLGRLGCFLAGCCYGVETEGAFGVQFPHLPAPVHPTQLYDASVALVLGAYLLWRFPRRRFDGENITLMLMGYSLFRATTEIFRGDPERGGFAGLSTSQWISVPLFLIGLWLYVARRRSGREATRPGFEPGPSEGEA